MTEPSKKQIVIPKPPPNFLISALCLPAPLPTSPLHGSRCWSTWVIEVMPWERVGILGIEGLERRKGNDTYYLVLSFPVSGFKCMKYSRQPFENLCSIWDHQRPQPVVLGTKEFRQLSQHTIWILFSVCQNMEFEVSNARCPQNTQITETGKRWNSEECQKWCNFRAWKRVLLPLTRKFPAP